MGIHKQAHGRFQLLSGFRRHVDISQPGQIEVPKKAHQFAGFLRQPAASGVSGGADFTCTPSQQRTPEIDSLAFAASRALVHNRGVPRNLKHFEFKNVGDNLRVLAFLDLIDRRVQLTEQCRTRLLLFHGSVHQFGHIGRQMPS